MSTTRVSRRELLAGSVAAILGRRAGAAEFTSLGGLLTATLSAGPATVTIAGRPVRVLAYNGQVPGPLLVVAPGDTVRLKLKNNIGRVTNLHFHGLHISPSGTADNVTLQIPAGGEYDYDFQIPLDHPTGTYWYHPHIHHDTANQVAAGLSGVIQIRGLMDAIPEIQAAAEHTLVLQDWSIGSDGALVAPTNMEMMQGREGSTVTVNAETNPAFPITAGGLLRLRTLNAAASRFHRLQMENHTMHLIATSGGPLKYSRSVSEYLLVPGERIELLVSGERSSGTFRLLSLPYTRIGGRMGGGMMRGGMMGGRSAASTIALASIRYAGAAPATMGIPARIGDPPTQAAAQNLRTFTLRDTGMMMMAGRMTINGVAFDPLRVNEQVNLNTTEEWEFRNAGAMDHPMHLHVNPFQIAGQTDDSWHDVVLVPRGQTRSIRVTFRDYPGRTMYHCHILDHEDMGMMGIVEMLA